MTIGQHTRLELSLTNRATGLPGSRSRAIQGGSSVESIRSPGKQKIKPFGDVKASLLLDAMLELTPFVGSYQPARAGIRRAVRRLTNTSIGIIDDTEMQVLEPYLKELQSEGHYAQILTLAILQRCTEKISNQIEYDSFSRVTMPEMGCKPRTLLWNDNVRESVTRHYTAMIGLRQEYKSAPRYRSKDHDYCEDLVERCCRTVIRPGIVRFTREIERLLGWTAVESTGVLNSVWLEPKFVMREPVGVSQ